MKVITIIVGLLVAPLIWVGLKPQPMQAVEITTCFTNTLKAHDIITLTNMARVDNGLPPLTENNSLDTAASLKAQGMISGHYWAHVSPTGVQPWYWFTQAGYPYVYAGENLEEDRSTTEAIMEAWMASPDHRANILKSQYTEIGVAVVCGVTDKPTTLVVQEFGSR